VYSHTHCSCLRDVTRRIFPAARATGIAQHTTRGRAASLFPIAWCYEESFLLGEYTGIGSRKSVENVVDDEKENKKKDERRGARMDAPRVPKAYLICLRFFVK